MRKAYSRGRMGTRPDLGFYVRSSWEANYARYLKWLQSKGQIFKWEYEPERFEFTAIKRGTRSYLPDFKVWDKEDAKPYYIEVKGWADPKSITKAKRMAKYYPEIEVRTVGKTEYNALKKWAGMIPHWE